MPPSSFSVLVPMPSEMLELHRYKHVDWKPSPVVALASCFDGAAVAAARDNGAIEIWNVSPGSVGWHCELVIPGKKDAAISCLLWCPSNVSVRGRLFSAGLDGFISEWDLSTLQPKEVLKSYGGSVWHMALEPLCVLVKNGALAIASRSASIGQTNTGSADSDSDNDENIGSDSEEAGLGEPRVAVACDDGCVRLFTVKDDERMVYKHSLPRVQGRILTTAWSADATRVFSGGSDGCIRCWDARQFREVYRITVGLGGVGSGSNLCIWSLITLRDGTIVSGDSTGSTQFWDGKQGTLLQAHTTHRADVLALAASPSHRSIFAAGADGQVVQYQLVTESSVLADACGTSSVDMGIGLGDRWLFVGSKRTHSHDVRALVVAYPVLQGEVAEKPLRKERKKSKRSWMEKNQFKSDHSGIPMLVSGGNDAKLFTYPANAFLAFHPHDVCSAPQRTPIQVASKSRVHNGLIMMAQHEHQVDVWKININPGHSESKDAMTALTQHAPSAFGKRKLQAFLGQTGETHTCGHVKKDASTKVSDLPNGHSKNKSLSMKGIKQTGKIKGSPPELIARIKCKSVEHVSCSALSDTGQVVAFSDQLKPRLFEIKQRSRTDASDMEMWEIRKRRIPKNLPPAHSMVFSGSSHLILACPYNTVFVVDIDTSDVLHQFKVERDAPQENSMVSPITRMCTSSDGQWLATVNNIGDITVFNLETFRQHWCVPPLDGSPVTAVIFHPGSSGILIIATSANLLHVLDVEARRLGEWSRQNGSSLPRSFLEFPGGIQGLSMSPSWKTTSIIAYGAQAMCLIDFKKPVPQVETVPTTVSQSSNDGNHSANGDLSSRKHGRLPNGGSEKSTKNFVLVPFKDPVLFLGHVGDSSILLIEKPWSDVLHQLPPPVYRHLYGT